VALQQDNLGTPKLILRRLSTANTPSTTSSDETDLLSSRGGSADRCWMTHMLVITTTYRGKRTTVRLQSQ
jgi:hypothetical protein